MQVLGSYYYSRAMKRPCHRGMPVSIAIEPTTHCNLRCPECPSGLRSFTRSTGSLDTEFFAQMIGEVHRQVMYLNFYFQGEPYLNPDFLEMVSHASKKNIYTATSTNAHYLDEENARRTVESGLDRLIISIDGTTQESYAKYRIGGELQRVIDGTKNIVAWKKKLRSRTPHVIFQFVVFRHNEQEIAEVKKLGRELGVNEVRIKTAQVYDYENGNELIPLDENFSRYKRNGTDFKLQPLNLKLKSCWRMWNSCVITWDGLVVPCCFDKDAKHRLGDLKERSFSEIWKNGEYKKFRAALLRSRKEIDICKNCSEGTKVWV